MEDVVSTLIPKLSAEGVFGAGEFVEVRPDNDADQNIPLASETVMLRVVLRSPEGIEFSPRIVAKCQLTKEDVREWRDTHSMFHNEIVMYREILPRLNLTIFKHYPHFFFGLATQGDDWRQDVLIVGNLNEEGYSLTKEKVFLDAQHIAVTIRTIAEFHSWSYTTKLRNPDRFQMMKSKLKQINTISGEFDWEYINYMCMKNGVDQIEEDKDEDILKEFLKTIRPVISVSKNYFFAEEEPFSVIIHGDFCKNNVLYKYDGDVVSDCAYFDFQLAKYASPVLDLAFFLYMHTREELRKEHWDDWLRLYWDTVRQNVPSFLDLPSFGEFLEHFASRAVYGFVHSSYFLPVMIDGNPKTDFEGDLQSAVDYFLSVGGEEGQRVVKDIAQHLYDRGYIHSFVKHCQQAMSVSDVRDQ